MAKKQRPMINTYEAVDGVERLVYREMNDEEYAQWTADQKAAKEREAAEAARPHPLIEQVQSMSDEDKALLKELLA